MLIFSYVFYYLLILQFLLSLSLSLKWSHTFLMIESLDMCKSRWTFIKYYYAYIYMCVCVLIWVHWHFGLMQFNWTCQNMARENHLYSLLCMHDCVCVRLVDANSMETAEPFVLHSSLQTRLTVADTKCLRLDVCANTCN